MIEFLSPQFLRARGNSKWATFEEDVIPSNPAEMDFGVTPSIQKALQDMVDKQQYGYAPHTAQNPRTRVAEAFLRRMEDKFGWTPQKDGVMVINDLVQGVVAAASAFTDPGQGIALQVPSYPAFLMALENAGRNIVHNPMIDTGETFELDVENLKSVLTEDVKILLLCHPHNPTGRVFTKEEFAPLAQLAVERDLIVVSDEIHADLVYDGRTHEPFGKMFPELADRTITLYSATKSFNIPGLRTGIMHFGSPELKQRFADRVPPVLMGTPGVPGAIATLAAWEEGQEWYEELVGLLQFNRDYMMKRFAEELPEVRMYKPQATYLAWADFSNLSLRARPYEALLASARVAGGDGHNFGAAYEQCVRFNFATSRDILDETIDRIVRCVRAN